MRHFLKLLSASIVVGTLFVGDLSRAASIAPIVSDDFSGNNGDAIHTRTPNVFPNVDLPGGSWYSVGTGGGTNNPFGTVPTINGNTALVTGNGSAFISIQSAGAYAKPTRFMISGDLKPGNTVGDVEGVGLGFSSANNAFDLNQAISLSISGKLTFSNVHTLIGTYSSANFGGNGFAPTTFYHLSYTVDTSTGGVSGITLSNISGSQSFSLSTTAFTSAATAYAGIFSNSTNPAASSGSGNIDSFEVAFVPEPASIAVLVGAATLVLRRRR
jgi:hypothetical protein